jgi:hypothetical protein
MVRKRRRSFYGCHLQMGCCFQVALALLRWKCRYPIVEEVRPGRLATNTSSTRNQSRKILYIACIYIGRVGPVGSEVRG